ncbi:MAG TPA: hypothetical protein VH107_12705 [Lacipirellulaceae bacterium]|nr:hypothetical protein [Lacipirellulaceae bacterium]
MAKDRVDCNRSPKYWVTRSVEYLDKEKDSEIQLTLKTAIAVQYVQIGEIGLAEQLVSGIDAERRDKVWTALIASAVPRIKVADSEEVLRKIQSPEQREAAIRALVTRCETLGLFSDCKVLLAQLDDGDRLYYKLALAEAVARGGNLEEARSLFQEANSEIAKTPTVKDDEDFIGMQRDVQKVIDTCSSAHPIEISYKPPDSSHSAVRTNCEMFLPGTAFIVGKDAQQTIDRARSIADRDKRSGALRKIAATAMKKGDSKEALRMLDESLDEFKGPDENRSVDSWLALLVSADYLLDLGEKDRAVAIVERAKQQNANDATGIRVGSIELGGMARYLLREMSICLNVRLNGAEAGLKLTESTDSNSRFAFMSAWASSSVEHGDLGFTCQALENTKTDLDRASICIGIAYGLINATRIN